MGKGSPDLLLRDWVHGGAHIIKMERLDKVIETDFEGGQLFLAEFFKR